MLIYTLQFIHNSVGKHKMKYNIKSTSVFFFIVIFMSLSFSISYLIINIFGIIESNLVAGIVSVAFLISIYYVSFKLTTGISEIKLTNKTVEFNWIKKPLLTFQKNTIISLKDIENWKFRTEFHFDYIKIQNSSNEIVIIKLHPWNQKKDNFYDFLYAYKNRIKKIE